MSTRTIIIALVVIGALVALGIVLRKRMLAARNSTPVLGPPATASTKPMREVPTRTVIVRGAPIVVTDDGGGFTSVFPVMPR